MRYSTKTSSSHLKYIKFALAIPRSSLHTPQKWKSEMSKKCALIIYVLKALHHNVASAGTFIFSKYLSNTYLVKFPFYVCATYGVIFTLHSYLSMVIVLSEAKYWR